MPSLWLKSVVHPSALTASPALGVVGVLECIPAVLRWTWVTPWTSSPLGQHSERDKELDTVTEQYSKINSTGSAVGFTVMGQFNSQLSPSILGEGQQVQSNCLPAHPACKHTECESRQNVPFQTHTVHFAARRSAAAGGFCAPACGLLSGRKSILMPRRRAAFPFCQCAWL